MAKVGVAAINPITSLSTCASGLLLSGIDEFRNSYRDYMFRKVDGAIGNSAYGEQYYKAKAFVYELEKKACAAYEACQNLPQTLIKLALPKSAPDRILHGVDLIKNGKFKARGGILLGIAGVLFAGTGIGAAGVVAGLYTAGGGISQIAEGVQEVYYGIKGDTDTEVENVYSKYIYDDYYGCYDGSLEISASCGYSAFVEGLLGGAGLKNAGSGSKSGSNTNPNALSYNGDGSWTSNKGLVYGQGSKDGNRVKHVLQHTVPNDSKPLHTVYNVDKSEVIGLIDEAWVNKGQGILQSNGNVLYDINMGKIIGTNGEDTIRIITKGYSNNIITAFPLGKGVN